MEKKLIWLDLEMTGLDPNAERIIEIYTCVTNEDLTDCLLYTSPSPRDRTRSRMPSSA